jgi:hypothetical protein
LFARQDSAQTYMVHGWHGQTWAMSLVPARAFHTTLECHLLKSTQWELSNLSLKKTIELPPVEEQESSLFTTCIRTGQNRSLISHEQD